jgi:hypothetical protein
MTNMSEYQNITLRPGRLLSISVTAVKASLDGQRQQGSTGG